MMRLGLSPAAVISALSSVSGRRPAVRGSGALFFFDFWILWDNSGRQLCGFGVGFGLGCFTLVIRVELQVPDISVGKEI